MNYKPKEQIADIDTADVNNDLAVVEYVEEICKFYKLVEVSTCLFCSVLVHLGAIRNKFREAFTE